MKAVLAFLLLLLATSSHAVQVPNSLSWTPPTTRENGDPLTTVELSGYELSYSIDGGQAVTVPIPGGSTVSKTIALSLASKATPYKTEWTIVAVGTNGLKSAPSKPVLIEVSVPFSAPGTPQALTIKIDCSNAKCTAVAR